MPCRYWPKEGKTFFSDFSCIALWSEKYWTAPIVLLLNSILHLLHRRMDLS